MAAANNANVASASQTAGDNHKVAEHKGLFFTPKQYNQILSLLNKDSRDHHDNMAGIVTCLMSNFKQQREWIVDSGATHHITYSSDLLNKSNHTAKTSTNKVHLPTEEHADVTHVGTAKLFKGETICNVLYVPDF